MNKIIALFQIFLLRMYVLKKSFSIFQKAIEAFFFDLFYNPTVA